MRNFKILLTAILTVSFMGCSDSKNEKEEVVINDGSYTGTLKVDQNDGTFYTQENVSVKVVIGDGSAEIKMLQVSFSPRMPLKLDMTIPGVATTKTDDGLSLSGDNIIPLAMGGEFSQYTITGMTGKVTPQTLSFELMCGSFPLTFSGSKQ